MKHSTTLKPKKRLFFCPRKAKKALSFFTKTIWELMDIKNIFKRSLDFWIITFICVASLAYIVYCEIFPTDWLLSKKRYEKNDAYLSYRSFTRYALASKKHCHFDITLYVKNPEMLFSNTLHDFFGDHHDSKVVLSRLNDKAYIVKKYKCSSFLTWLKWVPIRSSKAFRSWHFGCKLTQLGIPTAAPVLMIEKKIGPFWTSTYIVREYINGISTYDYFSKQSPHKEEWKKTLLELKTYLELMNQHKLIHGKISLHNTFIYEGKPYFLDLDLMHQYHLNHQFYKKRVENQHFLRLRRKFAETCLEAQHLFVQSFEQLPR